MFVPSNEGLSSDLTIPCNFQFGYHQLGFSDGKGMSEDEVPLHFLNIPIENDHSTHSEVTEEIDEGEDEDIEDNETEEESFSEGDDENDKDYVPETNLLSDDEEDHKFVEVEKAEVGKVLKKARRKPNVVKEMKKNKKENKKKKKKKRKRKRKMNMIKKKKKKINQRINNDKRRKCNKWTEEEDELLAEAVRKYSGKSWKKIAEYIGTKSSDQCNQHWHRVLNPEICKDKWSDEEEEILLKKVKKYGKSSWKVVSEYLDGRTDIQCRHKYFTLKDNMKLRDSGSQISRKRKRRFSRDFIFENSPAENTRSASKKRKLE